MSIERVTRRNHISHNVKKKLKHEEDCFYTFEAYKYTSWKKCCKRLEKTITYGLVTSKNKFLWMEQPKKQKELYKRKILSV